MMSAPVPDDIRDIRGPLFVAQWWPWIVGGAGALVAAAAVYFAVRAWRRARARRANTPLARARAALLLADEHARAGRVHEWAEIVAEVTRSAIAVELGAAVLPATTQELAPRLWERWSYKGPVGATRLDVPRLLVVLEACDLARFARAALTPPELLDVTATVRAIVEELHAPAPRVATPNPSLAAS